ncbi:hypothetical protein HOLleu_17509 [Holothuria leucospilota]|uniref:Uncharacterized protein n=1 Tax=Holothuria leucospilota TaxID=206669 RepID=A0A9Q1C254_HOLLE|nr:hypothetical protein HOLleu_17509 [Holothuria leucospilota]
MASRKLRIDILSNCVRVSTIPNDAVCNNCNKLDLPADKVMSSALVSNFFRKYFQQDPLPPMKAGKSEQQCLMH